MKSQYDFFNEVLKDKKTAIFIGAGFSRNSGIPTVSEMLKFLCKLAKFENYEEIASKLTKTQFEIILSNIKAQTNIDLLSKIFSIGSPNANHYIFSELAKNKGSQIIFTTNFDTHLETAFNNCKIEFLKIDGMQLLGNMVKSKYLVAKLHGCIDVENSIALTIESVANYSRRKYIETIFQNLEEEIKTIAFLGYSHSDKYDVEPALKTFNKKIINWNHSLAKPEDLIDIEVLTDEPVKEINLYGDTDKLVKFIAEKNNIEYYFNKDAEIDDWRSILEKWWDNLPESKKQIVLSVLFRLIGDNDNFEFFSRKAYKYAQDEGKDNECHAIAASIGSALRNSFEIDQAIIIFESLLLNKNLINSTKFFSRYSLAECLLIKKDNYSAFKEIYKLYLELKGLNNLEYQENVEIDDPNGFFWAKTLHIIAGCYHTCDNFLLQSGIFHNKTQCLTAALESNSSAIEICEKAGYAEILIHTYHLHGRISLSLFKETKNNQYYAPIFDYLSKAQFLCEELFPYSQLSKQLGDSIRVTKLGLALGMFE